MARAKVDVKGRIALPAEFRRRMGLGAGDEVIIEKDEEKLIIEVEPPKIRTVNSHGGWRKKPVITAKEAFGGP